MYFGRNPSYIKIGKAYLDFEVEVKKVDGTNFTDTDVVRLVDNAFANGFWDRKMSTSSGSEAVQKKYVGPASTILRVMEDKDGDLSSFFDR